MRARTGRMSYVTIGDLRRGLWAMGEDPGSPPVETGELEELHRLLLGLRADAVAYRTDLQARANALVARRKRNEQMRAKVLASRREVVSRTPKNRATSLAGGSMSWFLGQVQKIDADVKTGRWTDLLVEIVRLTPEATGKNPEEILAEPIASAIRNKYLEVYKPQDAPELREIGAIALTALSRNPPIPWDGETPAPPPPPPPGPGQLPDLVALRDSASKAQFDAAVWAQNFQVWAQYVKTHQKDGNFVKKSLKETAKVVATLDRYVPGWSVLIDMVAPSIPILAPLALAIKALPVVGGPAGKIVGTIIGGSPGGIGVPTFYGGGATGPQVIPGFGADIVLKPVTDAVVEIVKIGSPIKFTVMKVTARGIMTKGDLLTKLTAAANEALNALNLYATIGCLVVAAATTAGTAAPACAVLSTAIAVQVLRLDALRVMLRGREERAQTAVRRGVLWRRACASASRRRSSELGVKLRRALLRQREALDLLERLVRGRRRARDVAEGRVLQRQSEASHSSSAIEESGIHLLEVACRRVLPIESAELMPRLGFHEVFDRRVDLLHRRTLCKDERRQEVRVPALERLT